MSQRKRRSHTSIHRMPPPHVRVIVLITLPLVYGITSLPLSGPHTQTRAACKTHMHGTTNKVISVTVISFCNFVVPTTQCYFTSIPAHQLVVCPSPHQIQSWGHTGTVGQGLPGRVHARPCFHRLPSVRFNQTWVPAEKDRVYT